MASWKEFEARAPEMAVAGKRLLYQFGPGLAFLATIRKDGAPRLHPICPTVFEDCLYALILTSSPKCSDLKRDALERRVRVDQAARGIKSSREEALFRFEIDRVLYAKYPGGHGTGPPEYTAWWA